MTAWFVFILCLILATTAGVEKRIHPHNFVGSKAVKQGELGYQISIRRNGNHICSGAFILHDGKQVVITSAHCVSSEQADKLTVVAGDIDLGDTSGIEQTRKVSQIISHEGYDDENFSYDIALLLLRSDIKINKDVNPIPLPKKEQPTEGKVVISGWTPNQSKLLQKISVPALSEDTCDEAYPHETVLPNMLCVGNYKEAGKIACQGESGAPVRAVDGKHLAGIVSWSYPCNDSQYPTVSTQISHLIEWIDFNIDTDILNDNMFGWR